MLIFNNEGHLVDGDQWVAVGNPDNKDWVQIGNEPYHYPGKPHNQNYGYPDWGDKEEREHHN